MELAMTNLPTNFTPTVPFLGGCIRRCVWGRDVLFHGTRYPQRIIAEDRLKRSPFCKFISFTRSPDVAAHFALLRPRDNEEERGAVLIFDRMAIKSRVRLEPWD